MQEQIRFERDALEYDTAERCAIIEVSNDLDDPGVSIARARVSVGVTTAWHSVKNTEERYLIIAGSGRVEVGATLVDDVGPGDVVRIPANVRQRITNIGDDDLIFYAICSPRFKEMNYVSLE